MMAELFVRRLDLAALQFCLAFSGFLFLLRTNLLLDRQHNVRPFFAEMFEVEMLDILPEGHFPWLLIAVVHLAEILGVQPQLTSHLNVRVR